MATKIQTDDKKYVKLAWDAFNQGLSLPAFAHTVAHLHTVDSRGPLSPVRGKLYKLRKQGHKLPRWKRAIAPKDKSPAKGSRIDALVKALIEYCESEQGPLYELWEADEIYSRDYEDEADRKIVSRLYTDERNIKSFHKVLEDIQAGQPVGYLSASQSQDREDYPMLDLYIRALNIMVTQDIV